MADVVLVHGIENEQKSADSLESEWLPSLAGGVRIAGFDDIADQIWRTSGLGSLECRMAFYGDLFLTDLHPQGASSSRGFDDHELAEDLALEWLTRAASRSSRPEERMEAERTLWAIRPPAEAGAPQGTGNSLRPVLRSLAKRRWFAARGMSFAEKFLVKSLQQVTRYFTDEEVREEAINRVLRLVNPSTKVVIGHSLGSVVAFEALHRIDHRIPLFVTLGSPLGMGTVVYDRLRPQPPTVPICVEKWINVMDPDDLVAIENDLSRDNMFGPGVRNSTVAVDNGSSPHNATSYLVKREVGHGVARALLRL